LLMSVILCSAEFVLTPEVNKIFIRGRLFTPVCRFIALLPLIKTFSVENDAGDSTTGFLSLQEWKKNTKAAIQIVFTFIDIEN
jgi:hypothetical protein